MQQTVEPGPLGRILNATRISCSGLGQAWRTQAAVRYEVLILAILVPLAWLTGSTPFDRALLISSWLVVIIVEFLNSAIETVVDRIGRERHELSGRAKDLGSAAVFCAILQSAMVWLLFLLG